MNSASERGGSREAVTKNNLGLRAYPPIGASGQRAVILP
jgi:hypothetical protein